MIRKHNIAWKNHKPLPEQTAGGRTYKKPLHYLRLSREKTKIKFENISKPLQKYDLVQPMPNERKEEEEKKRNKCIIFLTMHYILIRIYNYTTWVHLHTTLNVDLTLTTTPIFRVPCNSSKKEKKNWYLVNLETWEIFYILRIISETKMFRTQFVLIYAFEGHIELPICFVLARYLQPHYGNGILGNV